MTMLVSTVAGSRTTPGEARQRLGEAARVGVVLGEARDVVLERVEAGGGEDAGLAHAAAEHLATPVRRVDERLGAGDERADRRAEPLRQADAHGVERRGQLGERHPGGDVRVPQAGAVEVQGELVGARDLGDLEDVALREDAAAAAVVRVLDGDERGGREVVVVRVDGGGDVGGGEEAARCR